MFEESDLAREHLFWEGDCFREEAAWGNGYFLEKKEKIDPKKTLFVEEKTFLFKE
ncbi:MAG: hypothetical protein H6728_14640 [Myxococcales bacterium]|nr:hypothetical protein [Myxococcales bacterium]MCB9644307.1 hypothetical protein [Myxococcales bacterium]